MRVKIGPFRNPPTLGSVTKGIASIFPEKYKEPVEDYLFDKLKDTWVDTAISWLYDHWADRKIKVKIHNYDVWNADHTMAVIIHPLLIKLREDKHGSGIVDPADAPAELGISNTTEFGDDDNLHRRWEWVLDEMIWAFGEIAACGRGEEKFFKHPTESETEGLSLTQQIEKIKVDREGLDAYHKRINNGLRLFGKYYRSLWT